MGAESAPTLQLDPRSVEALGHAYFIQRGGRILISPYDTATYDFVVELGDKFTRVNVKRAGWDRTGYRIVRAGGKRSKSASRKDPDLYLAWLTRHHRFIEVPASILVGRFSARLPQTLWKDPCPSS